MSRIASALKLLVHVEDTPHRIALAFGIGIWIAFFPIWGLHTAMALAIAFLFRLSRAAMILGAYVNNPWTVAPLYTAGTVLGCWLLRVPVEGSFDLDWSLKGGAFLEALVRTLRPYLWPFIVGNTIVGVAGGAFAYFGLRWVLERRRRAQLRLGSAS